MPKLKIASIFGLLLLFLALRFFFFYQNQPKYYDGQNVSFQTTLLKEPQVFSRYQSLSANLSPTQEVFITIPLFSQLSYGDSVKISGSLKEKMIDRNRVIMTMFYPEIEAVKDDSSTPPGTVWRLAPLRTLLSISSFIRQKTTSLFEKTLPQTSSSLLLGIVFGVKETMPQDFKDSLRISGVFHVVAASGMNVTMVAGFLSSIFGFFLKRQVAILATIIGIVFYAVLAGLDPPIVRASIMGGLVFISQLMGRQTLAVYGLFLSGFVMLFFSPNLLFDIGFQLSFLATFGLLFIRPILERKKKVKSFLEKSIVGEGLVTTIAAQTATLPILVGNFGTYSLWSIIVNSLVLWTIPILMVIGGLGVIFGMIIPQLGSIILYLSLPFLLYFEKTIMFFGKMGGTVGLEELPWQIVASYYLFLCAFMIYFSRKK